MRGYSFRAGLNRQPADYKSAALPIELRKRGKLILAHLDSVWHDAVHMKNRLGFASVDNNVPGQFAERHDVYIVPEQEWVSDYLPAVQLPYGCKQEALTRDVCAFILPHFRGSFG